MAKTSKNLIIKGKKLNSSAGTLSCFRSDCSRSGHAMVGHHFHELLITIYCIYSVYAVFSPGLSSSLGRRWCWLSDPCRGGKYDACSCCVRSPGERASSSCWVFASSTTLHETAHVGGTRDGYFDQTLSAVAVLKTKAMSS